MDGILGPDGDIVDRVGQQMLYLLWERDIDDDGVVTTTEFRQQLNLGQSQEARHRLKGVLARASLVAHAGTRPGGGPEPVDYWTITDRGRQWVTDNIEEIAPPQTLDEACEQVRMLSKTVEQYESRLDKLEGNQAWLEQQLNGMGEDIESIWGTFGCT